ncbi:MAG: hypothetical protein IPL65_15265 [Lewinellaceae bacterium]|nr:hypothetical protein [Lewinellaceae bacterium]
MIFCVLLGLGYALLLYYRDQTFREQSPMLSRFLGLLRFLVVTTLSALLLSPLLKSVQTETKKPVVILAQDQSESIGADFTPASLEQYKQQWQALRDALATNYEVHEIAFGDAVREGVDFSFSDKITNFSELLQNVYDLYGNQNLGAVVMATDGIYNEGSNPAYSGAQLAAPVFTVALGDTSVKKDLLLKRVFHNKIAYLGDKFTIQIDIAANNCAGAQTVLTVSKVEGDQRRQLQSIPLQVNGNDFFTTKEVVIEADQPGVAQYLISVAKVPGEVTAVNNSREIFIDVLDARQKILVLANGPHPDLSAMRQMLEGNKNYQVTVAFPNEPGLDITKYDFAVLHNLPSTTFDISGLLQKMDNQRMPRLFVAGMQTNYTALSGMQNLVTIRSDGRQSDEVQATVSPQFSAFSVSPNSIEELPQFSPVTAAFGVFKATPQAQVILWKRIGKISTDQPLLAVGEINGARTGILMAEGIWKWRLFDYLNHQNYDIFDEVFGKTVQYLSLKDDKRKFRVTLDQNIFNENEAVRFSAELYNDNYELTNEPDVALVVRSQSGKEFPYTFNRTGKAYTLSAGILPVGNYTYKASTNFNGKAMVFEGKFSVRPIQLELFETTANHAVLQQLSTAFGGVMVSSDSLLSIADKIKAKETVKPVIFQTNTTSPLINLKWIFAILAGFLALEWFLRRYFGAY